MADTSTTEPDSMTTVNRRAQRLRALIAYLGWSQREAASRLGSSGQSRISEWTRGARPVPDYIDSSVKAHHRLRLATELLTDVLNASADEDDPTTLSEDLHERINGLLAS